MLLKPMHEIVNHYNATKRGHWFNKETMRFFRSRLSTSGYLHGDNYYFISSEKDGFGAPRRYTVRMMTQAGNIENVGPFNRLTRTQARKLLAETMGVKVKDL